MAYAKTQKGAQARVRMKRVIRRAGVKFSNDATTAQLKKKYRQVTRKK